MNGDKRPGAGGATGRVVFLDLQRVAGSLSLATLLGLLLTLGYSAHLSGWAFTPQVLWAMALWVAGIAVGFLFGIPKVLQGKPAPPPAPPPGEGEAPAAPSAAASSYEQRVNTNLEEISDWLTKIIIGTGLIQLKSIPEYVVRLGSQVVRDVPGAHVGFGIAVVIFFTATGFLFGYLVTRLYIQGALARAERNLGAEATQMDMELRWRAAETALDVIKGSGLPGGAAAPQAGPPGPDVERELSQLADEYKNVKITDWQARVQAKDRLTAALVKSVLDNRVSRDWLAAQGDEALTLALAALVQVRPEPGDTARLLRAPAAVQRLHVRYRIVLALSALFEQKLVSETEKKEILALLDAYDKGADTSLARLIAAVRNRMTAAA